MLSKIQPAVYEESQTLDRSTRNSKNPSFVENVADLNVRRSVRSIISRSYILEHAVEAGKVAIIGAKHDLATGVVTFFDDTWIQPAAGDAGGANESSMYAVSGRVPGNGTGNAKAAKGA